MQTVPQWTRFEFAFEGPVGLDNPIAEASITCEFRHESGESRTVDAFWDGGRTWRVRFQPHLAGAWSFNTSSMQAGEFLCVPYAGDNPLHRHGAISIAGSGTHFAHCDGTPFFWLGDTVWNGPLKATLADWTFFLADRAAKGFNVIQFVPTQWVAGAGNADLRHAYISGDSLRIDPAFFQWLDRRIDLINEHGMIASPAIIWSAPSKKWALPLNPGTSLPEDQIVALVRYIVARYGAHHIVWMLAGDGDYRGPLADRWRRIGRAALQGNSHPVTMHPMGAIWVGNEFADEPWYHFHGYQSSHWDRDSSWRWITHGPPAEACKEDERHPIVNLEPCYEAHLDMSDPTQTDRHVFDDRDVRRACYWSLLVSPTAGVTYGASGVWSWETTPQPPMNHVLTGIAPHWSDAMRLPGSGSMRVLKQIFAELDWWLLRPAPELIAEQPAAVKAHIAAARSSSQAIVYVPEPGEIKLSAQFQHGEWINPADGSRFNATAPYRTPADGDWVLVLR